MIFKLLTRLLWKIRFLTLHHENLNDNKIASSHFERYFLTPSWLESLISQVNEFRKEESMGPGTITCFSSLIQSGTELIVTALTPNAKGEVPSSAKEYISHNHLWLENTTNLAYMLNHFIDGMSLTKELKEIIHKETSFET